MLENSHQAAMGRTYLGKDSSTFRGGEVVRATRYCTKTKRALESPDASLVRMRHEVGFVPAGHTLTREEQQAGVPLP